MQPTPSNHLLQGYILGLLGVAIFALTLPFTRIAVQEMSPLFLSIGRTVAAAVVAGPLLLLTRQKWPSRREFGTLAIVAAGVVLGLLAGAWAGLAGLARCTAVTLRWDTQHWHLSAAPGQASTYSPPNRRGSGPAPGARSSAWMPR